MTTVHLKKSYINQIQFKMQEEFLQKVKDAWRTTKKALICVFLQASLLIGNNKWIKIMQIMWKNKGK